MREAQEGSAEAQGRKRREGSAKVKEAQERKGEKKERRKEGKMGREEEASSQKEGVPPRSSPRGAAARTSEALEKHPSPAPPHGRDQSCDALTNQGGKKAT